MTSGTHESEQGHSGSEDDGISSGDSRLAKLSLLIDTPEKAEGRVPDSDELWDWMHGCVEDPVRAAQIRSHVARDPDVFERWHEMRLSEGGVEEWIASASAAELQSSAVANLQESTDIEQAVSTAPSVSATQAKEKSDRISPLNLSAWLSKLGALMPPMQYGGVALAAILGGVVAINLTRTQPVDVWSDWQTPKSLGQMQALPDQQEVEAVLAGVAGQLNELSLPVLGPNGETLPQEIPACTDVTESGICSPRRQALYDLGSLAVSTRVLCLTNIDIPDVVVVELSLINNLIGSDAQAGRFAEPVAQWTAATEQSSQCSAVNVILSRALLAATS